MNKAGYKKGLIILMHAAAWILLFSLPYLLTPAQHSNEPQRPELENEKGRFIAARISDLLLIGFFYLNAGVLMVRFFYQKKYLEYILSVFGCFSAFLFSSLLVTRELSFNDITLTRHLPFATFIFLFILASSIAYKTIKDRFTADRLAREKENENLKTELSLLRSQVSPHFMFNVLNNMVALARKQSDLLEPSLIKLSSLMRYMLYETGEQKVSLEKEADYLQSYIDLQKMRFGNKVAVNVTMNAAGKEYEIEPMLLIPFVENAFKHGTGMIEGAQIDIYLEAKNDILYFAVRNKYNPASQEIKDDASGIGLVNVRRRLELLYTNKHTLAISKDNNTFGISLEIQLT
jgi:two-component system LytT family sensor kinase